MNMSLAVLVINYEATQSTINCLESVGRAAARAKENIAVWVLDNSRKRDRALYDQVANGVNWLTVRIVHSSRNLGYGGGLNYLLDLIPVEGFRWIWIINNDVVVAAVSIQTILRLRVSETAYGAIVHSGNGGIQAVGGGHLAFGLFPKTNVAGYAKPIDYINGASILLPGKYCPRPLFDTRFFMYWEDVDLGVRLRRLGWQLKVIDKLNVTHKIGASGTAYQNSKTELFYCLNMESLVLFYCKHLGIVRGGIVALLYAGMRVGKAVAPGCNNRIDRVKGTARGFWSGWRREIRGWKTGTHTVR